MHGLLLPLLVAKHASTLAFGFPWRTELRLGLGVGGGSKELEFMRLI